LLLDLFVPTEGAQRLGAALVEVRTARLADGTRIALRSETTTYSEERIARTHNRYVHRRGTAHLAEETDATSLTWYPCDEIVEMVRDAGFASVEVIDAPCAVADAETFGVFARL
jgi:hypothetical protein